MSQKDLHESLESLRVEIAKLGVGDEAIQQRMQELVADLELQLERSEGHEPQLLENVRRHIETFEVEHPRLTAVLNQIMVSLSNLGI